MTNILDFAPGDSEKRGEVVVTRYADPDNLVIGNYSHDRFWKFGLGDVALLLSEEAIRHYGEDEAILSVVMAELERMSAAAGTE